MKHVTLLFLMIFVVEFSYAQTKSITAGEYRKMMNSNGYQIDDFNKQKDALLTTSQAYVEMVSKVLADAGVSVETDNKKATRQRQHQYNWMVKMVPIFVSAVDTKSETADRINLAVKEFGEVFGLDNVQKKDIKRALSSYAEVYSGYIGMYYQLQNVLLIDPTTPPPPPPLPLPGLTPQQHHTGN